VAPHGKAVVPKDMPAIEGRVGDRIHTTFVACGSAPQTREGWPEASYAANENAYMTNELWVSFCEKFCEHVAAKGLKNCILITDFHSSRLDLEAIFILREAGHTLLVLPPHTTQILQPYNFWISGFRATGIWPFNPAIHPSKIFAPAAARQALRKESMPASLPPTAEQLAARADIAARVHALVVDKAALGRVCGHADGEARGHRSRGRGSGGAWGR